jgi:hypothetical protein
MAHSGHIGIIKADPLLNAALGGKDKIGQHMVIICPAPDSYLIEYVHRKIPL